MSHSVYCDQFWSEKLWERSARLCGKRQYSMLAGFLGTSIRRLRKGRRTAGLMYTEVLWKPKRSRLNRLVALRK